jgi:hypothetical protein
MKRLLAAALFASLASLAHASPASWRFTFSNLEVHTVIDGTEVVDGDPGSISGIFTGEDLNHDGVLTAPELTRLDITLASTWPILPLGPFPDEPDRRSELHSFTFDFGHQLHIDASYQWWFKDTMRIVTGQSATEFHAAGGWMATDWNWTPDTVLSISPVPEPATSALMGLGLFLVGAMARRPLVARRELS